ncbi:MAG: M81 family metallopeptidase [Sphaerochaetaceae bacterium]
MKRVVVGGMHHESNTFNPILADWQDVRVRRGEHMLAPINQDSIGGVVSTLQNAGYEVIPTLIARAVPNGEWKREVYASLKQELLDTLSKAGAIDGICFTLHGSMRVEGIGEAEGDLLAAIREIQPEVPLITSLDMHATITDAMLKNADGFVGYKCAPHTDTFETGVHAANMMIKTLEEGAKPVMEVVRIPMIVAGEQSETSVEPMVSLMAELKQLEKKPSIMAASYLLGFPWADTAPNSIVALVVADNNRKAAQDVALQLAKNFWERRSDFHFYNETHMPEEALAIFLKRVKDSAPVVISDSGDNPTAGSSGDVTGFLKLMLASKEASSLDPPALYQCFYDPALVEQAFKAGVGASLEGALGAAFDTEKSSPVIGAMTVKALIRDWDGNQVDLALIHTGGIDVVVSSKHVGAYDPEMMRALGVVPEDLKLIVVKLGYLEPEIRAISNYSVMALTEGSTNEVLANLPYKQLPRPVYPLDQDAKADWE